MARVLRVPKPQPDLVKAPRPVSDPVNINKLTISCTPWSICEMFSLGPFFPLVFLLVYRREATALFAQSVSKSNFNKFCLGREQTTLGTLVKSRIEVHRPDMNYKHSMRRNRRPEKGWKARI
jgi:hypothetical protein